MYGPFHHLETLVFIIIMNVNASWWLILDSCVSSLLLWNFHLAWWLISIFLQQQKKTIQILEIRRVKRSHKNNNCNKNVAGVFIGVCVYNFKWHLTRTKREPHSFVLCLFVGVFLFLLILSLLLLLSHSSDCIVR